MIDQEQGAQWVWIIPTAVGIASTVINGLIAMVVRSWNTRIAKVESDNDAIWRKISAFEIANARNGATRLDLRDAIEPLQRHLAAQDSALKNIQIELTKLAARSP